MNIRELYIEVSKRLQRIDFTCIWKGFHKYDFALYNDSIVYLRDKEIPVTNQFLGNTSIEFEGKLIAIWNMTYENEHVDVDELTSNLIHEMFHCFQKEQGETRYPNDLHLLRYPDNLDNYSLKYQENIYLAQALYNKEDFFRFVQIRQKRMSFIGDFINQEFKVESIEGLAEYCGTQALKQLSKDKYNQRIERYCKIITTLSEEQFDIRRISYYVGTLFFSFSSLHGYSYNHDLTRDVPFFQQIHTELILKNNDYIEDKDSNCKVKAKDNVKYKDIDIVNAKDNDIENIDIEVITDFVDTTSHIQNSFNQWIQNKTNTIHEFLGKHNETELFNGYICGYDPMNMIRLSDKLYCSHFVMVNNDSLKQPRFIPGPVLLYLKEDSDNLVNAILK